MPEPDWQDRVPLWVWDLITVFGLLALALSQLGKRWGWWA